MKIFLKVHNILNYKNCQHMGLLDIRLFSIPLMIKITSQSEDSCLLARRVPSRDFQVQSVVQFLWISLHILSWTTVLFCNYV